MSIAFRVWVWLTSTFPGAIVLYGITTWLVGEAFRQRTDAQWAELRSMRWPWKAYLYWAKVWAFVGTTCRRVGVDGPAIRRAVLGAVLTKGVADRMPGDETPQATPALSSTSGPPPGQAPFDGRGSTWPTPPSTPPPAGT